MRNTRLYDRHIIRLSPTETGEDVRQFLQGLVTQDTAAEMPLWAGLLSPQGKALFDFFLWADGYDVLIDCERVQAEALARRLSIYRLRRKISITMDSACAVFWNAGGSSDPRHPNMGERWLGASADDDVDVSAEYRAHRLALGITEGVVELGSEQTLWLETNAAEENGDS